MREMEDAIGLKDDPGGGALSMGQLRAIERNEVRPRPAFALSFALLEYRTGRLVVDVASPGTRVSLVPAVMRASDARTQAAEMKALWVMVAGADQEA